MEKTPLFKSLKDSDNLVVFAGFSLLFFGLNYLVMKNLPGTDGYQCLPDSLNIENIVFSIMISFIMGIFIVGMKELFSAKKYAMQNVSTVSLFSVGGILSLFTIFCPVCTIGVVSIFGLSFGLNFFVDYEEWVRVVSILLLVFGLYWINGQLKDDCKVCNLVSPKK